MKTCTKCQRELPASPEFFHRDKASPDGLYSACKKCRSRRARVAAPDAKMEARSAALELLAERHETQFQHLLRAELIRRGLQEPGDVKPWRAA